MRSCHKVVFYTRAEGKAVGIKTRISFLPHIDQWTALEFLYSFTFITLISYRLFFPQDGIDSKETSHSYKERSSGSRRRLVLLFSIYLINISSLPSLFLPSFFFFFFSLFSYSFSEQAQLSLVRRDSMQQLDRPRCLNGIS